MSTLSTPGYVGLNVLDITYEYMYAHIFITYKILMHITKLTLLKYPELVTAQIREYTNP